MLLDNTILSDVVVDAILSFLTVSPVQLIPGNSVFEVVDMGLNSISGMFKKTLEIKRLMLLEKVCMTLKLVI